ncbi:MAG: DUF3368 domain-containing protein [Bacteroidetes bacterium SW_8_64_56]|nr:MAG: DUF3368 domain-containing protein [Bacteroidetes bacterium SW_8_64_56]
MRKRRTGRGPALCLATGRVTGVLGVLLCAKAEGRVGNVESLLKNLREEADFWISDALWKDVLRRAGERYENLTSETAF